MQKSPTSPSGILVRIIVVLTSLFISCSLEEASPPVIRGHTKILKGIPHGSVASRGERYCQDCHGVHLQGGIHGEPSCYRCHGRNWLATGPEESFAPADHTAVQTIFNHHPNLHNPDATCAFSGCHGPDLTGDPIVETPSCYLCHNTHW